MNASVLIVDDERSFRVMAEEALAGEGFEVRAVPNLSQARQVVDQFSPDIILLDRRLPDGDGIDFLHALRTDGPDAPIVIVITAYAEVDNAVEALRAGASDYLSKPIQLADLMIKLQKVLEARGLRDRLALARNLNLGPPMVQPRSAAMSELTDHLHRLSQSPITPVFILGPSGVGKQYAAETLHAMTCEGKDQNAPFVEVNCAALPDTLVESELFGHEKGSFTNASSTRRGLIEMAQGGTLFLDEISELPMHSQAKLLKFVDTMRFRRLGGQREITVQLRIVAASNRNVREEAEAGRFREDLYHRLAVFEIAIPGLAERTEDILPLAEAFARFFAGRIKKRIAGITDEARTKILSYGYPGHVRELRNIIERAVILAAGPWLTDKDIVLPSLGDAGQTHGSFFSVSLSDDGVPPTFELLEREYLRRVLAHHEGRRMVAARTLGVSYPTLLKRLRELELDAAVEPAEGG
jgi:two-component system, NtrC family, response regulator AtoC